MTVTFTPYSAPETDGQFWKWPEACQRDPERFTLELNNRNAADVLARLGYPGETWLDEPLRIDEFAELVRLALRRSLGTRSPAVESQELPQIDTGMTVIECGRAEGYIERRLYDLAMLAARAREAGATHIGWA
jgi:hypothetical protein